MDTLQKRMYTLIGDMEDVYHELQLCRLDGTHLSEALYRQVLETRSDLQGIFAMVVHAGSPLEVNWEAVAQEMRSEPYVGYIPEGFEVHISTRGRVQPGQPNPEDLEWVKGDCTDCLHNGTGYADCPVCEDSNSHFEPKSTFEDPILEEKNCSTCRYSSVGFYDPPCDTCTVSIRHFEWPQNPMKEG
jgi:hypothetical protein